MRTLSAVLLGLGCLACAAAQQPGKGPLGARYRVEVNAARYPQATPQDALKSVLKSVEDGKFFYLLAQLSEPEYVDRRVQEYRAAVPRGSDEAKTILAFERLTDEVRAHLQEDPALVKELYRLSREGEWQAGNDTASVRLKSSPERGAFFQKLDDRWFLLNRQTEPPEKKGG